MDSHEPEATLKKRIAATLGMMLAGVFGWYAYANVTAETRVRELCALIADTSSVEEADVLIRQVGMERGPLKPTGTRFVAEGITFGRHACKVETLDGRVTSSSYDYAD